SEPGGNPRENFVNMNTQAGGAQGGPGPGSRLGRGATRGGREPVARPAEALLGPIGSALLELAAVNALRSAAALAFSDRPVDSAYQLRVVAAKPRLPALASGPGLDKPAPGA